LGAAVTELIRRRARQPLADDDLVSVVARAVVAGEDPDFTVRTNVVMSVVLGGLESTGAVLAGAIYQLATDPASRDRIAADRSLLAPAVEESLRLYTSVAVLQREVVAPRELHGVFMQPGDKVLLYYAAANRDPREFTNPDSWDMDRGDNRHLAFGLGNHRCLGSNLARLVVRTALDHLLDATPQLKIAPDQQITFHSMPTRGIDEFRGCLLVHIVIDSETCQGHARCLTEVPGLLELDDDGHAMLLAHDDPGPVVADRLVRCCPERAISYQADQTELGVA
jgi:cytochrome P450/ferredoxin